jgi:hypothetical protein
MMRDDDANSNKNNSDDDDDDNNTNNMWLSGEERSPLSYVLGKKHSERGGSSALVSADFHGPMAD